MNPFSPPETESKVAPALAHDEFIINEVTPLLREGERMLWTAFMQKAPSLWLQVLFAGIIMVFFIRPYLVAVTNERIILLHTRLGFLKPKMVNRGVETIEWREVVRLSFGGFANNRSIDFHFVDGSKRTLRIGPWTKFVGGQRAFFDFAQAFDQRQNEVTRPS